MSALLHLMLLKLARLGSALVTLTLTILNLTRKTTLTRRRRASRILSYTTSIILYLL